MFIDEIHTIVGAGSREGALDAGDILKPVLARGEFSCIGATTTDEYEKHLLRDKALARRFQPVWVHQPSVDDAIVMLRGIKDRYEAHHRVRIADAAVVAAVEISAAHIPDRFLPDKAIDLVDEAASQLRLDAESVPPDLAAIEQNLLRLEIEHQAFKNEDGKVAELRRSWLAAELARLRADAGGLRARWEAEKQIVTGINDALREEERARAEEEQARRFGELQRAAEIAYRALPEISRRIEMLEAQLVQARASGTLLRDTVTPRDVAAVAASWTGQPIEALLRS
jgi:ATP-dependent Clp protease ATP-binding subunit ClpB